jgi:hypothetical protein
MNNLVLFSPPRSRLRRSSNFRLQIHLRHQFRQLNHTSTSTHKNSTIFTIEKSSKNFSRAKRNQLIFKVWIGKQRVGEKKIEESEVVTKRNSNTNLFFFSRQIQGMAGNICRVKYFMDMEE